MAKKQTKYQQHAKGQDCQLRLPGCRNNTETVVLCHVDGWFNKMLGNQPIGLGIKSADRDGVDGCFTCHNYLTHPPRNADRDMILRHYLAGRDATRANRERRGIT